MDENIKEFEEEVKKIMNLGYDELHAGCYIVNYYDDFICEVYNGGCKNLEKCKELKIVMGKDKNNERI